MSIPQQQRRDGVDRRSSLTNDTNRLDDQQFSHFVIRQLPAEVLYDAIEQATANSPAGAAADPADRAISAVPRSFNDASPPGREYALKIFGKPKRLLTCDCERTREPTMLQSLYLQNDEDILKLVIRDESWGRHLETQTPPAELIRTAYLRTLSRPPTATESARCERHLSESKNLRDGLTGLLLALINSREFMTNH